MSLMAMDMDDERVEFFSTVRAYLKWFNFSKGFGFVVPEGTEIDVFLHITSLQRAGIRAIGAEAVLMCQLEKGRNGVQVREVIELVNPGIRPERVKPEKHLCEQKPDGGAAGEDCIHVDGSVKWYKPEKGFGFVTADDGKKDIFIHDSCLHRRELSDLRTGMRLSMKVKSVPKGREVVDFEVIEN